MKREPFPTQPHDPEIPAGPCVMCRAERPAGSPYCPSCWRAGVERARGREAERGRARFRFSSVEFEGEIGGERARQLLWDLLGAARSRRSSRTPRCACGPTCSKLKPELRSARRALGFAAHGELTRTLVKERRRELALKHHPDRDAGATAKMAKINAAVDVLLTVLD